MSAATRTEAEAAAAEIDANLAALARTANDMANRTGSYTSSRWARVALACLGMRREIRPLLHDDDRSAAT